MRAIGRRESKFAGRKAEGRAGDPKDFVGSIDDVAVWIETMLKQGKATGVNRTSLNMLDGEVRHVSP